MLVTLLEFTTTTVEKNDTNYSDKGKIRSCSQMPSFLAFDYMCYEAWYNQGCVHPMGKFDTCKRKPKQRYEGKLAGV